MLLILLSMLLIAVEALLSICWPHWTSRVTVFTRKVQTFPGSCCTMLLILLSMFVIAVPADWSMFWPHSRSLLRASEKTSAILPGSAISALITPSTRKLPCSSMTVDGEAMPKKLLKASRIARPMSRIAWPIDGSAWIRPLMMPLTRSTPARRSFGICLISDVTM